MKLFKKLLPIASVATIGATIAPMVTSCGVSLQDIKNYESKITQHPEVTGGWTDAEGTKNYYTDSNIKNIIKDDLLLYIKSTESNEDYDSLKAGIDVLSIKEITGKDATCYAVSYNAAIEAVMKDADEKVEMIVKQEMEIRNAPLTLAYLDPESTGTKSWFIAPVTTEVGSVIDMHAEKWADYSSDWTAKMHVTMEIKYDGEVYTKMEMTSRANKDAPELETIGSGAGFGQNQFLIYSSNYLGKVVGK